MTKSSILFLTALTLAALAFVLRTMAPYPTATYFIFPAGVATTCLVEFFGTKGCPRWLRAVTGVFLLVGCTLASIGPYVIDGKLTILLSPVMPVGIAMGCIGAQLLILRLAQTPTTTSR